MIERFLNSLRTKAKAYLVSRLKDERLGFGSAEKLWVFLPDLHLLGTKRAKAYSYGPNFTAFLAEFLTGLGRFKQELEQEGKSLKVYQLGDCIDLWREVRPNLKPGSPKWTDAVRLAMEDNDGIISPLLKLGMQMTWGNHDFDLQHFLWPAKSDLKYFFSGDPSGDLRAGVLHGDVLSAFERTTSPALKKLAVYLFGPGVPPSTEDIGKLKEEWREWIRRAHGDRTYTTYIQQRTALDLAGLRYSDEALTADRFNVQTPDTKPVFLAEAKDFLANVGAAGASVRVAFIGHTHWPRIAVDETGGGFFALVDCGAWIENCRFRVGYEQITMGNAQVAVLHNNDIRVYQLSPLGP